MGVYIQLQPHASEVQRERVAVSWRESPHGARAYPESPRGSRNFLQRDILLAATVAICGIFLTAATDADFFWSIPNRSWLGLWGFPRGSTGLP